MSSFTSGLLVRRIGFYEAAGYALVVAAFLGTSCGDDDDGSSTPAGRDEGGAATDQSGNGGQNSTTSAGTDSAGTDSAGTTSDAGTTSAGVNGTTGGTVSGSGGDATGDAGEGGTAGDDAVAGGSAPDSGEGGALGGEVNGGQAGSLAMSGGADSGGSAGSAEAGATGVDCGCVLGAYVPMCGVDGMTYDAACGIECVPVDIACRGECPCTGPSCGGVRCGDNEECCGPPDCGYCIPIGTDPACAGSCETTQCGDGSVECLEPVLGFPGEVCLEVVISSGPTETTSYECARNPCGDDPVDCDCAGDLCADADPITACSGPTLDGEALRCSGGGPCNSPDTLIATPAGDRPIASLEPLDLVYSVHDNALVAVPLLSVSKTAVHDHSVVRIVTESSSVLEVSPGHPTGDGRTFSDLAVGDRLDGQRIVARELVPYAHPFTYDILPESDTGTYVAAGMLIGTTFSCE